MIAQKFLVEFAEPDGKDVLEIGCGDGRLTAMLADWAESYVAVDSNADKLAEAEARVPGVAFVQGNAEALDFSDESFDVVLFTLSLHHVDAWAALGEARRVLRQGGRVVVLEPVPFSEMGKIIAMFNDETEGHRQAQEALADGPMPEVRRELFRTEMTWDDAQEMTDYLFDRHKVDYDEDLAYLAEKELGDKRYDAPLLMQYDMLIVMLGKID